MTTALVAAKADIADLQLMLVKKHIIIQLNLQLFHKFGTIETLRKTSPCSVLNHAWMRYSFQSPEGMMREKRGSRFMM